MADLPPLVTDLTGFPGAPFPEAVLTAAIAEVRAAAGWHIAPSVTETVTAEIHELTLPWLIVPTLQLASITEVRYTTWSGEGPTVVTGYLTVSTKRFRGGVITRHLGWRPGVYEVDIVHGYDECPADLLPALAAVARDVKSGTPGGSVHLGSLSISGTSGAYDDTSSVAATLNRYRLLGSR